MGRILHRLSRRLIDDLSVNDFDVVFCLIECLSDSLFCGDTNWAASMVEFCYCFHSGLSLVSSLFDYDENKLPIFTEEADESSITPGLFYSGPSLVHRNALFYFIYKFRARFGVIAAEIARRLGLPNVEENLEAYAKADFMNTDLDCCSNCECAIETDTSDTPEPESFANS